MKKREIVKGVLDTVIYYGTGTLVGCAIVKLLPPTIAIPVKVCAVIAGTALGWAASKPACAEMDEFVDNIADLANLTKEKLEKETAEA